ncbi:hypothetical protein BDV27DRAFT_170078 [Aspergillus caelatus]|uniref:Zn(2)-C6 fungal-type domain-containing protein n=1 Tax=Aspergillus caelatus TaxID=61420 RepID=A0A5N7AL01_9EURO|nr:uncharacterized protein BDV27DRAFT_170078 [Aspergillus caelatus]KAE8370393.1 hypothetical protein BDV27DRAFT_170078 [Aspergillus caelatus]
MASTRSPVPRRAHTKSRNGCVQCKRRHIKCDEKRPKCTNCTFSHRQCVFNSTIYFSHQRSPSTTPPAPSSTSSQASALPDVEPQLPQGEPSPPVNMLHAELFHHLFTETLTSLADANEDTDHLIDMITGHSISAPYLVNELLGMAALHLSLVRPAQQEYYRFHATQLQTHAISQFNSVSGSLNAENWMAIFLFSSALGTHMLCETLRYREDDWVPFLDRFVQYAQLHRGVRGIAGQTWDLLKQTPLGGLSHAHTQALGSKTKVPLNPMYAGLLKSIKAAKLGSPLTDVYRRTIEFLQIVTHSESDTIRHPPPSSIIAWPVLIPEEYLECLTRRRPEALVIFAYYATNLHFYRGLWIFGDAGKFLVERIIEHLGPDWESWLGWPIEVVNTYEHPANTI